MRAVIGRAFDECAAAGVHEVEDVREVLAACIEPNIASGPGGRVLLTAVWRAARAHVPGEDAEAWWVRYDRTVRAAWAVVHGSAPVDRPEIDLLAVVTEVPTRVPAIDRDPVEPVVTEPR